MSLRAFGQANKKQYECSPQHRARLVGQKARLFSCSTGRRGSPLVLHQGEGEEEDELMAISEAESPLLADGDGGFLVDNTMGFKGHRAVGGWRSSAFLIGSEVCEKLASWGVVSNLINYLTGPLHQSNAMAAANVNIWLGVLAMLPLLGAYVADAYLGHYMTILISGLLYLLGLGFLTLSMVLPFGCGGSDRSRCASPPEIQVAFFFFSLYLVALGAAGHKPCLQAFSADQFDESDPKEKRSKNSFFNWWCFASYLAGLISILALNYVQEYLGWGLEYGVSCMFMASSLAIFLVGTFTYRFKLAPERNPFTKIAQVFVAAIRKSKWPMEESNCSTGTNGQFGFLNRAAIQVNSEPSSCKRTNWIICSVEQVEEVKGVLRLIPIWAACLAYGIFPPQSSTFFTKQGSTMDRKIGPNFSIPAAALQCFIAMTVVIFLPIYDRILVPVARSFTGLPSGITLLQRIGTGMFLSILALTVAALVELKRLKIARDSGLVDLPMVTLPMSIFWLLPQYVLCGASEGFAVAGMQQFFYDQMPESLRSAGVALYISVYGLGCLLSGFLVSLVEKLTKETRGGSWFSNNLNKAHLDYYYWALAGLNVLGLCVFLFSAQSYVYRSKTCFLQ
ncbi:protein NRT1/ PTR FAMILY 5.10-like [Nymphaea colorata]|uniref:protein NRT1/ PTR FAMILY 5.10-like n=1 Tax=Nymphaea colorata TaxID=210225 RepID=UPI00214E0213|nr:protein NRT1/ PTR FAMILY 5.10-like [Nymphaea colorata]